MSTGSRESTRSTQSEWIGGAEKKKKSGLIGKLKKLTRGMSAEREREFGSGSDISSVSIASSNVTGKPATASAAVVAAAAAKKKEAAAKRNPMAANEPFDKYFSKASASGMGSSASAAGASASGAGSRYSTLRR